MKFAPFPITYALQVFTGDPVKAQWQRVEDAIKIKAERVSDMEYNRTMAHFYTERVADINPHTHWWDFADAKQKQHEHQMAFVRDEKRVEEATARADAHISSHLRMLNRSASPGASDAS